MFLTNINNKHFIIIEYYNINTENLNFNINEKIVKKKHEDQNSIIEDNN